MVPMMKKTNAYIPTFSRPIDGDIAWKPIIGWPIIPVKAWAGVKSGVNAHLRNDEGWRD